MTSFFQASNTGIVPAPLEADPSASAETTTIPEDGVVLEVVTHHTTPSGKTDIVPEDEDVSDTEPVDIVNNRRNDPGIWVDFSTDDVANYWTDHGPNDRQDHTEPFERLCRTFNNDKQTRYCSQKIFFGIKANGEKYTKEWLLYSPSTGSVYCFVCKLFAPKPPTSRFAAAGYSDWRNNVSIEHHENDQHTDGQCLKYIWAMLVC